jgi:hypothetical protein
MGLIVFRFRKFFSFLNSFFDSLSYSPSVMTQNEATESNMAIVNYDTTFPIDDYRHYFKYEDRIMGGIVKKLGVCRDCTISFRLKS